MSLILTAVIASGVLASKGLLELGVHSLRLRYPLAALGSYLVFVLLVRLWIWYVRICCSRLRLPGFSTSGNTMGGSLDLGSGGGSSSGGSGFRGFGGGDSGGGGASGAWEEGVALEPVPVSSSSSSSGWLPDFDLGGIGDGDGWLVLLLAALVLAIVGAGGYLVWAAPHILPEAATQALLASTLARAARQQQHSWINGILRSTCLPFVAVLTLAGALGWAAHHHCPAAVPQRSR